MVNFLKSESLQKQIKAADALWRLVCNDDDNKVVIVKANGIPPLVDLLIPESKAQELEEVDGSYQNLALKIIGSVFEEASPVLQVVDIKKWRIIPSLTDLRRSGSAKAKEVAFKALVNLGTVAQNN